MNYSFENGVLTYEFSGKYNASKVEEVDKDIFEIFNNNPAEKVIIDCENLEYISSAGLRIILRLGKLAKEFLINNVSKDVYEILNTTGFTKMFNTRAKLREISVDGLEEIGGGLSSDVYRIDRETIVKMFKENVTLDRIYKETESAKKSFLAGIPTAITYDIVKCGNRYGTVFELIDAETLSQNFMDHPEKFNELMEKYVALLKQFHSTEALPGTFPDIVEKYHNWANGLKKYMEQDEIDVIYKLIDAVPRRNTLIHVDCHSRNIMVEKGDNLVFVDMADVSVGHPLFDIGAEYFHYVIFRETSMGAKIIFGVEPEDKELPVKVWNALVDGYFPEADEKQKAEIHKMLKYFGCLRCLIMVAKHAHISKETAMELINRQRRDLLPFADEAIELFKKADEYFI